MTGDTRLLPWSTPDGKPCFLMGSGTGFMARMADNIESVQLGMAGDLLDHADDLLADPKATPPQLRFLLARMSEALRDVRRIADSRGARLPVPDDDRDGLDGDEDEGGGPHPPADVFG
ncbi:hypothetical protein AB0H77_41040 [Streptomyces sp. NPDC050844]|uniref:hypothetical protein n=1 Tax=Streptomyces sp. NPDC050844 TaxID=3155790 RepID=UPI0033EFED2A